MINQKLIEAFRKDYEAAMLPLAEKYGLEPPKLGRVQYSHTDFKSTATFVERGGLSPDAKRYDQSQVCTDGRWPKVNTRTTWGNEEFTVVGMGRGGAIQVSRDGKLYNLKREQWDRKHGGLFDSPTRKLIWELT